MPKPKNTMTTSRTTSFEDEEKTVLNIYELNEQEIVSLNDARKAIKKLKEKYRNQTHQLLICIKKLEKQEETINSFQKEKADQLKALSHQFLLFEARLIRKQKNISKLLHQRDDLIVRQQQALQALQRRLIEVGVESSLSDMSVSPTDSPTRDEKSKSSTVGELVEALQEKNDFKPNYLKHRSFSDSAVLTGNKFGVESVSNGESSVLKKPIALESCKGTKELTDEYVATESLWASETGENFEFEIEDKFNGFPEINRNYDSSKQILRSTNGRLQAIYGSFEKLNQTSASESVLNKSKEQPPNNAIIYNRVVSNHRSVTKPKDIKYRRINKAKSKSFEELRT